MIELKLCQSNQTYTSGGLERGCVMCLVKHHCELFGCHLSLLLHWSSTLISHPATWATMTQALISNQSTTKEVTKGQSCCHDQDRTLEQSHLGNVGPLLNMQKTELSVWLPAKKHSLLQIIQARPRKMQWSKSSFTVKHENCVIIYELNVSRVIEQWWLSWSPSFRTASCLLKFWFLIRMENIA